MTGIVITLSLLACILVISEACSQASGGPAGGVTQPPSGGDNVYGPGSGPIPPTPVQVKTVPNSIPERENTKHKNNVNKNSPH